MTVEQWRSWKPTQPPDPALEATWLEYERLGRELAERPDDQALKQRRNHILLQALARRAGK
jgi:hypothetical protein